MTTATKGILLALVTAFISGYSNFFAKTAVTSVGNPLVFTTLKNSLVGLAILIPLFTFSNTNIKKQSLKNIPTLVLIAIIGGSIPFLLYFTGLLHTSAPVASFIHKTMFLWIIAFSFLYYRKNISLVQIAGIALLVTAQFVFPGLINFQITIWEAFILSATILWALENLIAQRVLKTVSVSTLLFWRMSIGSVLLFIPILIRGKFGQIFTLSSNQWLLIIISSVLLFGYVQCWYRSLKYIPLTTAACILTLASPITNIFSLVSGQGRFDSKVLIILAASGLGCLMIASASRKSKCLNLDY